MNRRSLSLGLALTWALLLPVAAACAQVPVASTPVGQHGLLRVQGNRIVDQKGEPVVLRGMSLFWAQWMPQFYNKDAIRWLRKDWNVNIVRAAIPPEPGGYNQHPDREMAKLEQVIDAAIEQGIYVVVDWHAHEPSTKSAVEFFEKVSRKYGAHPNIIYEPWNEPLPKHDWKKHIKPHHAAVTAAIRANDPDNLIVAGTQSWSQDVDKAAKDPLADANTAYVLHFYAGTHRQELRDKAQKALDRGVALFVSEWGTTLANGDDLIDEAETRRWWAFLEANRISYLNWSIADKDEKSAALRPGASPTGGWPDAMVTESGGFVRGLLRTLNPRAEGATWTAP